MNQALVMLLMVLATILAAYGALFLKLGAARFRFHWSILRNGKLILGGTLYTLSTIVYLVLLKYIPLSIAYPLTSMSYIWVTVLSARYLKERIDGWHIAGIACIILGVILLNLW